MSLFKVGDRVVFRKDAKSTGPGDIWVEPMDELRNKRTGGQITAIGSRLSGDGLPYCVVFFTNGKNWNVYEQWLELEHPPYVPPDLPKGDPKVIADFLEGLGGD